MKKDKIKNSQRAEEKKAFLGEDKYYSKIIKNIDGKLTFNKSIKKIKLIKDNNKYKLSFDKFHQFLPKAKKVLTDQNPKSNTTSFHIEKIQKKQNNSQNNVYNDGNFHLNKISKLKRLTYLPKISPYIYNNNTSISIDYNKANEMGARGFRSLCDNESDSIKEILFAYNDHNFQNIEDYNSCVCFNKINDRLKRINKNEHNNITNVDTKIPFSDKNNNDTYENKNIFDNNFINKKKSSKLNKLLKNKIERIKTQNKKVKEVLKQYKNKYFNKVGDNRVYKINYNSIEKHIPFTIINSKSKRMFPEKFLKKYNSYQQSDSNIKNNEKRLFLSKLKNNELRKSYSNRMICSYYNLYSSLKKNKSNFLKDVYITKENINFSH